VAREPLKEERSHRQRKRGDDFGDRVELSVMCFSFIGVDSVVVD
jgi:hypothetical protein